MKIPELIASLFKRIRTNARLEPSRDWMLMLILSSILLIGIIVWNAWVFDTVSQGGVIGTTSTDTTPIFSRSSLDAIQAIFTDRAAEDAKYETGVYRYNDPSQ